MPPHDNEVKGLDRRRFWSGTSHGGAAKARFFSRGPGAPQLTAADRGDLGGVASGGRGGAGHPKGPRALPRRDTGSALAGQPLPVSPCR